MLARRCKRLARCNHSQFKSFNSPPIFAANQAGEVGPQGSVPLSGLEEGAGASGLGRRNVSMSTGNLADLYPSVGLGAGGVPNCDLHAGLRGVASTSNIWDGQVHCLLF